jgi:hypothetical protein
VGYAWVTNSRLRKHPIRYNQICFRKIWLCQNGQQENELRSKYQQPMTELPGKAFDEYQNDAADNRRAVTSRTET